MKILTIDTASDICASMIQDNTGCRSASIEHIGRGHAERLIAQIEEVRKQANCSLKDLDAICVNTGPGSFTGIRIGVAAARGLSLALNKPALGVSYFTALAAHAHQLSPNKNIAIILNAYNNHYNCMFWQYANLTLADFYNIDSCIILSSEEVKARLENGEYIAIGDTASDLPIMPIQAEEQLASLDNVARQLAAAKNSEIKTPKPFYMSPYQAQKPNSA